MAPSPIAATTRYIPDGATRIYWVATIVDITDPTRLEIDAGLDLTAEVGEVAGWHLLATRREARRVYEGFGSQLPGTTEVDDARLVLYASEDGDDVAAELDLGEDGHVLYLHGGDVEDHPMDVWPVRLAARSRMVRIGGEPVRLDHQFTVTSEPALDVPVPV